MYILGRPKVTLCTFWGGQKLHYVHYVHLAKSWPLNVKLQIQYMPEKKYYRKVRRQGHSLVITIPNALVENLDIDEDQIVEFVSFEDRMELIPMRTQHTSSSEGGKDKYDLALDKAMENSKRHGEEPDVSYDKKLERLHLK